jgi:hypothetical protein
MAARNPSNTSIGVPPGLASLLTMIGGTELISTALATRPLPYWATYRATSPPPVEWPTWIASRRPRCSVSAATSAA